MFLCAFDFVWPDNYTIDYTYSDINKLDQVKAGSLVLADYNDDSLGRTASISYANGASSTLGYENDGDLDYVNHSFVGGANNLRITKSPSHKAAMAVLRTMQKTNSPLQPWGPATRKVR